jgi:hypothetical protein
MRKATKWTPAILVLLSVLGFALTALRVVGASHFKAEVVIRSEDMGIPGITKMYDATLTNAGLLPARVTWCNFVDDASSTGTIMAYAVQRWNESLKQWRTVVELGKDRFCQPYPMGIMKAKIVNGWLWPGQSISTDEEATAARDGFSIGDQARFVIFVRTAGDYGSSVATSGFRIDEHRQTDIPMRVRH